jgi:predicted  nucleic acid-binding Zn ribbon protein
VHLLQEDEAEVVEEAVGEDADAVVVADGVVDVAEDVDVEAVNGNQSPGLDVL